MKHCKRCLALVLLLCLAVSCALAETKIIVPQAYEENGTLPIYRAIERNFKETVQPEWFNQSGVAKTETFGFTYNDGAVLQVGPEALYYTEYDGTWERTNETEKGQKVTETVPKDSLACAVSSLASWACFGFPGMDGKTFDLEKTELTEISLAEAQARAEALMAQVGLEGYTLEKALDMSLERIHFLGDAYNAAGMLNSYRYDYSQATSAEEGYLLKYNRFGTDGDASGMFHVSAYVTASGVRYASICDMYAVGEVYDTPAKLVDAQTVLDALPKEMAASRYPEKLEEVVRATLTWAPARAAKKADGIVLTPVWQVIYLSDEAVKSGYECWATFNAVDGKLLSAIFN